MARPYGAMPTGEPLEYRLLRTVADGLGDDEHADDLGDYYDDPLGFAREAFIHPDRGGQKGGPNAYQADILSYFPEYRRVAIRGPHGLGKCLAYGETMRLADGRLVPVESLIGQRFHVLAVDDHLKVSPAEAMAIENGSRDVVEIVTTSGRVLRRTVNHPIWGDVAPYRWARPEYTKRLRPEGSWVPAGDLVPGSVICLAMGGPADRAPVTDSELILAAYLIGDGGLSSGNIRFSQQPGPVLAEFHVVCQDLGAVVKPVNNSAYDYSVVGTMRGRAAKNPVLDRAREWGIYGKTSHAKRFPEWVWQLGTERLALFLSRLYACDGWAHMAIRADGRTNREIGYCSVNEDLAVDVQRALLRLGILAEVRKKRTSIIRPSGTIYGVAYTVGIHDTENILRFTERVGIFGKEDAIDALANSARDANDHYTQKWQTYGLPEGFAWERIRSVRIIPNTPTVAITVPGYQTFLTDHVEHNTTCQAWLILWFACTREAREIDWKIPTTAGAWHQLTHYLWPEVHKWANLLRPEYRSALRIEQSKTLLQLSLRLRHGEAFAVASNRAELIEGAHATQLFYFFDEAKSIDINTWDAAEGAFAGGGFDARAEAFAMAASTPGPASGRFYEIHRGGLGYNDGQAHQGGPGYEDWHVRHVTLDEAVAAGQISRNWANQRGRQWGVTSPLYLNRVLGEFASSASDTVIPLAWVEKAQERWNEWKNAGGKLPDMEQIACDVGRGGNKTVLAPRHGNIVPKVTRSGVADTMLVADQVGDILDANPGAIAMIDVVGIGAGVYDRLRQLRKPVFAFNAGSKSPYTDQSGELTFVNRRAEAWWRMRELLDPNSPEDPVMLPEDKEGLIAGDLSEPRWHDPGGRIQVEDKEEVARRLGRSTDDGDAIVMTFAPPITQTRRPFSAAVAGERSGSNYEVR